MNRYGNCKECDIKIQNDDYLICCDCCRYICYSCLDTFNETYTHSRCSKCKEYATCSNSNICYDCNICHYDMITPTIAVGDCESSYEEFDIIVNLFMEMNDCSMNEIIEENINNKKIYKIGMLDHPGSSTFMLNIMKTFIPKLINEST